MIVYRSLSGNGRGINVLNLAFHPQDKFFEGTIIDSMKMYHQDKAKSAKKLLGIVHCCSISIYLYFLFFFFACTSSFLKELSIFSVSIS